MRARILGQICCPLIIVTISLFALLFGAGEGVQVDYEEEIRSRVYQDFNVDEYEISSVPPDMNMTGAWTVFNPTAVKKIYKQFIIAGLNYTFYNSSDNTQFYINNTNPPLHAIISLEKLAFKNIEFDMKELDNVISIKYSIDSTYYMNLNTVSQSNDNKLYDDEDTENLKGTGMVTVDNTDVEFDFIMVRNDNDTMAVNIQNAYIETPNVTIRTISIGQKNYIEENMDILLETLKYTFPVRIKDIILNSTEVFNESLDKFYPICSYVLSGLTYDNRLTYSTFITTFDYMALPFSFKPEPVDTTRRNLNKIQSMPSIRDKREYKTNDSEGDCSIFKYDLNTNGTFTVPIYEPSTEAGLYISIERYADVFQAYKELGYFDCYLTYSNVTCGDYIFNNTSGNFYFYTSSFTDWYDYYSRRTWDDKYMGLTLPVIYNCYEFKTNSVNVEIVDTDNIEFGIDNYEKLYLNVTLSGLFTLYRIINQNDLIEKAEYGFRVSFSSYPRLTEDKKYIIMNLEKLINSEVWYTNSEAQVLPFDKIDVDILLEEVVVPSFNKIVSKGVYHNFHFLTKSSINKGTNPNITFPALNNNIRIENQGVGLDKLEQGDKTVYYVYSRNKIK